MEQAVVEFTWNEAEYVTLARKYGASRVMARLWVVVALACFGIGIKLKIAGIWPYAVGAFYLVYGLYISRSAPQRAWRRTPEVREPQHLVFSSEGIVTHTDVVNGLARWDIFRYAFEREDCYLLSRSRRVFSTIIPKRAFSSSRDEAVFRALVRSHTRASLRSNPELDDIALDSSQ